MSDVEEQIKIDLGRLVMKRVSEAIHSVLQVAETDGQRIAILASAISCADAVAAGAIDAIEGNPALTTTRGKVSAAVFARMTEALEETA